MNSFSTQVAGPAGCDLFHERETCETFCYLSTGYELVCAGVPEGEFVVPHDDSLWCVRFRVALNTRGADTFFVCPVPRRRRRVTPPPSPLLLQ